MMHIICRRLVKWLLLGSMSLVVTPVFAMKAGQVETLHGSALLDLRVDAVFQQCGLPATIDDNAEPKSH